MSKEVMRQALEVLNSVSPRHLTPLISNARKALREALAEQPAQPSKPLTDEQTMSVTFTFGEVERSMQALRKGTLEQQQAYELMKDRPLYTSPPAQRKPLTDAQIMAIGKEMGSKCRLGGNPNIDFDYARAIEAAHGIKENT